MLFKTGQINLMQSPDDLKELEDLENLLSAADDIIESKSYNKQQKFNASYQIIIGITSFLRNNHPHINRRPLIRILEELVNINNGSEPNLFNIEKSEKGGRPPRSPLQNANEALIVVGIELLIDSGMKPKEALQKAKLVLGPKAPNLSSIRKSFKSRQRPKEFTNLMFGLKEKGIEEAQEDSYQAAITSLEHAKTYLK